MRDQEFTKFVSKETTEGVQMQYDCETQRIGKVYITKKEIRKVVLVSTRLVGFYV